MAIQKSLLKEDNEYRFTFEDVYFKIDDMFIDIMKESIRIGLRGYTSKESRENEGIGIYKKVFNILLSEITVKVFSKDELLKACYTWITKQEEFKSAKKV